MTPATNSVWTFSMFKVRGQPSTFTAEAAELLHHHQNGTVLDPWENPIGLGELRERVCEESGDILSWEVLRENDGQMYLLVILNH